MLKKTKTHVSMRRTDKGVPRAESPLHAAINCRGNGIFRLLVYSETTLEEIPAKHGFGWTPLQGAIKFHDNNFAKRCSVIDVVALNT